MAVRSGLLRLASLALITTLSTTSCMQQPVPKVPLASACSDLAGPLATDQIAFTSGRDGHEEIYVMNADGTAQVRLTHGRFPSRHPTWSPDGRTIFFDSELDSAGRSQGHFRMNADGSYPVRLASEDSSRRTPGTKPTLVNADRHVYVANSAGGARTQLIEGRVNDFGQAWSPDGSRLAFITLHGGSEAPLYTFLYVLQADGTGLRKLMDNVGPGRPNWSPDGKRIVVLSTAARSFYVIDVDGASAVRIPSEGALNPPAWSPDGAWLVYDSSTEGDGSEISIASSTCIKSKRLTTAPGNDYAPAWRPRP